MNTQLFKYVLEVEKSRSISQAAEKLFMAQPNLSKAIREVEDTLGFPVFRRSAKGVVPTEQGEQFLAVARNVVAQLDRIDAISACGKAAQTVSVSIPRASYVADGFLRFARSLDSGEAMELKMRETSSMKTLAGITGGDCSLGVIRCTPENKQYFLDYMAGKGLSCDMLWDGDCVLLMSRQHPLAAAEKISEAQLSAFIRVVHGDEVVPFVTTERRTGEQCSDKRISVCDRANQFELLCGLDGAYMWVSPVPQDVVTRYSLVQRRCQNSARRFCDMLVYPEGYSFTKLDRLFIDKLYEAKNAVAFGDYK